jgi:predicted RNA-binding protein with PIN domain
MALLIDGYNLLHVTSLSGKGEGPGSFQRSREALLRFLAASLDPEERKLTTVVFDATDAPPGLPDTVTHEEMTVRYARGYPDADALIEELIAKENAPRKLLVVSSDHRIQRAAKRRRARTVDSDAWYAQLWQRRVQSRSAAQQLVPEKPIGELSPAEIAHWVNEFSASEPSERPTAARDQSVDSPFPPRYGEDLL